MSKLISEKKAELLKEYVSPLPARNENESGQRYEQDRYRYESDDEIDLFEIFETLFRWKYVLAAIICGGLLFVFVFAKLMNHPTYETSVAFTLTFAGIEKHRNPDGSGFLKEQVIHPAILTSLAEVYDEEEILDVRIEPILPDKIKKRIEEKEDVTFFPDRYLLSFVTGEESSLSANQKEEILIAILNKYKERLINEHLVASNNIIQISREAVNSYEYSRFIKLANTRIDSTVAFIQKKLKPRDFDSLGSGMRTLDDIENDLLTLRGSEISQLSDIVNYYLLAKDRNMHIMRLKERIENIGYDIEKHTQRALISRKLLNETQATQSPEIVSGETSTLDSSLIGQLRQEDRVLYLLKNILESETKAKSLEIDRLSIIKDVNQLENGELETPSHYISLLNPLMSEIAARYNALLDEITRFNDITQTQRFQDSVKIISPPYSQKINSFDGSWKVYAIAFLVLLIFGGLCVLVLDRLKARKVAQTQAP